MLSVFLLLLSVRLLGTPSHTSRALGSQGWSVTLITGSYAYEGPTSQSSQGLAMMRMCLRTFPCNDVRVGHRTDCVTAVSNADRLLPHDAVSCSRFADLSQPPPSREQAEDFQLWLLCANRQLRQIVPMYQQLLELQCNGLVTNRAEAYEELGNRRYASDMAFVALVRRSLLDEPLRSNHVDEVGQKGAVTLELDTTIPSMTRREL